MLLAAATSQPVISQWAADIIAIIAAVGVMLTIAGTFTVGLAKLIETVKGVGLLKGTAQAQKDSIDRLSQRANTQDAKIHEVAMAADPERLANISRPVFPPPKP